MPKSFSAKPEASVEAMADHFEVLQTMSWNADVQGTVQQVVDYFNSIGTAIPWGKIIAILAPVAIKIWSGQAASIDWAKVVADLIALIPGPAPPVVDPTIP